MQFELTPEQIGAISLVAAILAQLIKIIFAWLSKPVDRKTVTVILLIVGMVMAYIWARPALPVWPTLIGEPFADMLAIVGFLVSLILAATAIVGAAQPIYNLLLQYVFEKIGMGKALVARLLEQPGSGDVINPPDGGMS